MEWKDIPGPLQLAIYIILAGFAFVVFIIGFGVLTRPMIVTGQNSIGNFTDNASAWQGFSASFSAAPLIVFLLFVGLIFFGGFMILKSFIKKKRG